MDLSVDATYENGVLKPISPLPLKDRAKVRVTVQEIAVERRPPPDEAVAAVRRTAGLLGKTGDTELLRRIAEDDEFGVLEAR
jgi:predicted DNA-binding antitoxin AbrB/MazE fold protein